MRDERKALCLLDAETHALCMAIETFLRGTYGEGDITLLADFGLAPRQKPGPKTTASKKAMVDKGRATREARAVPATKRRRKRRG